MDALKFQQEFKKEKSRAYRQDPTLPSGWRITGYYTDAGVWRECPEGYLTGDEFEQGCIEDVKAFCKEHGLL
jgi:hypothetical protein